MGRLPNENQSQRALGIDTGRRALGMFRGAIASRGSRPMPRPQARTAGAPIALNKYTRHSSHHWRRYAHHKSSKVALKSTDDKKAAATDVAADDADKSSTPPSSSEIPPSVANANAQLAASDSPTERRRPGHVGAGRRYSAEPRRTIRLTRSPTAESQVVAADQLNDVDRALHEGNPPAAPIAMASAEPPVASAAAPVVAGSAASSSDSTWDRDLPDRENLHRFRRTADDGLRRAHVHGVSAPSVPDAAPRPGRADSAEREIRPT